MGLWSWQKGGRSIRLATPTHPAPPASQERDWNLPSAEVGLNSPLTHPTFPHSREVIFDLETTGLTDDDRIVEIAAVELVDRRPTGRVYQMVVNPEGRPSHPKAEEQHGISSSQLIHQPLFAAIARDFMAFVGDSPLIAHNCFRFDQRILNAELVRAGIRQIPANRFRCTWEMARSIFGGTGHSLDALCDRFQIDRSHRDVHRALADCELLAAVYVKLVAPGPAQISG